MMPRARSPNRDKAFEIFKQHNGKIENRQIAKLLNEDEKVIAVWKSRDKWLNVIQQSNESCTTKKNKTINKVVAKEVKQVLDNPDLTDKQRLFCLYYSKSFNATQSYMKAYGCSYETALTNGPALLGNARVRAEIMRLKEIKVSSIMISEDDIVEKYMNIAFADITDYVNFGQAEVPVMGPFGPISIKDDDTGERIELTKIINTVQFKESTEVDGTIISEVKQGRDGASIKLADKMKALEWLSNYFMMNPMDKHKVEYDNRKLALEELKSKEDETETTEDDGFIDALSGKVDEIWQEE